MNAVPDTSDDAELDRLRAASRWLVALRECGDDDTVIADWLAWCDAAPENLDAFERIKATWKVSGAALLSSVPTPSPVPLQAQAGAVPPAACPQPRRHRRWRPLARAAGMLMAVGLSAILLTQPPGTTHTLSTPVALHATNPLPDGSVVELGARSRIATRFSEAERRVVIEEGEAYFDVAHDPGRPFVVQVGGLSVIAVGTAFNIRSGDERVVVTVTEGRVRLARAAPADPGRPPVPAVEAGAGEQATFSARQGTIDVAMADPGVATAWREGVLKFVHEPLDEVVANLNRYSTRQIVLADPRLAQLRYTGTVFGTRLDDWLDAVEGVFPITVTYDGTDRILLVVRSVRDE